MHKTSLSIKNLQYYNLMSMIRKKNKKKCSKRLFLLENLYLHKISNYNKKKLDIENNGEKKMSSYDKKVSEIFN